jgi:Tol biopolymer transport system component
MDARCVAGVAALGLLMEIRQDPAPTLLTLPQGDTLRSWSDGASAAVSADGHFVAFASYARLAPGDLDARGDIYVLDRVSGGVTLESVTADGGRIGYDCARPGISSDGRYLVFEATVSRGDLTPATVVVFRDRRLGVNHAVALPAPAAAANEWSGNAAISADGRVVVFESTMTSIVPGPDRNGGRRDIYLFDAPSGLLRRVSVDNAGMQAPAGSSYSPSVSADGRYVAFTSTSELDGVPAVAAERSARAGTEPEAPAHSSNSRRPFSHVYVRDTQLNVTTRVSGSPHDAAANGRSWHPVVSGSGRYVAFVSDAANLVPGDRNRSADVFLFDRSTGSTVLVSRGARGGTANGPSALPAISADGSVVAFHSDASDLVCARQCPAAIEDINLLADVFLFDRATLSVTQVSGDRTGGWMAPSVAPALDASGRIVTFASRHPIDLSDDRHDFDLFVRVPK